MKRFFLSISLFVASLCMYAAGNVFTDMLENYRKLGGKPEVMEQTEKYMHVSLSDSAYVEMYVADNILVVYTVCAPICSSCARVYNKEWKLIRTVTPPFRSIFPQATIENGRLVWKDNDTWNYQSTL